MLDQKKTNDDGVVVAPTNAFMCPLVEVVKQDFSDDKIVVTELVDKVEKGPSGEDTDFITYKAPKITDTYHHRKAVAERCRGQDLKSTLIRLDRTGDISVLNQRTPLYGDGYTTPSTLSEALEKGKESASFIDSLTDSEREKVMKMASDKKYFDQVVSEAVSKKLASMKLPGQVAKEEKKEGDSK